MGNEGTAQRILYSAFDLIKEKSGRDAMEVSKRSIKQHYACS